MGYDVPMEKSNVKYPDNILKIETKKFPLLGTIAAGNPIYTEEQFESYIEAGANIPADFCLKIQGDSMINARICDGDIVFIKKQSYVDDGQIAAVLINDEATLKRVYKSENEIVLVAENPAYKPMVYKNEELNYIRILGKAIAFQSNVL
jgi:repressor LexA